MNLKHSTTSEHHRITPTVFQNQTVSETIPYRVLKLKRYLKLKVKNNSIHNVDPPLLVTQ